MAMREKKGSNFAARRSYVYRQLEKLVEANLLEKKKSYQEINKPNRYHANFDLDIFQEIIEDQLRRKDLLKNLKEEDYSVQAEKQAEEVLDSHME
jgi:predicted transcriptional regulator